MDKIRTEERKRELEKEVGEVECERENLEEKGRRCGEEREEEADRLEFEKLKLMDMERQDR